MTEIANNSCFKNFNSFCAASGRYTLATIVDGVKVGLGVLFLHILTKQCLVPTKKYTWTKIDAVVIFAPLVEEVMFRGAMRTYIFVLQKIAKIGDAKSSDPNAAIREKRIRIVGGAIIFGALHALNPDHTKLSACIQVIWATIGGISYGYLREKYDSLLPGVVAHGLNNFCAMHGSIYGNSLIIVAIFANAIAFFILGTTDVEGKISRLFGFTGQAQLEELTEPTSDLMSDDPLMAEV